MDRAGLAARLEAAKRIADEASAFLLSHESLRAEYVAKAENDYVTAADRECERLIISSIARAFPDDAIYGEESGESGSGSCRWIIDPIDGTVDFMSSFPDYTVSIAFEDEEGPAVGVVAVPRQGEVFSAMRSSGAFLNGRPIHTDEATPLGRALAILVPPHRHHRYLRDYMIRMERFYHTFTDARSIGSAALSLCYVAAGRCAAYYEISLHLYDIAAGLVILSEAGGKMTFLDSHGEDWIELAASSASAHEAVLECING